MSHCMSVTASTTADRGRPTHLHLSRTTLAWRGCPRAALSALGSLRSRVHALHSLLSPDVLPMRGGARARAAPPYTRTYTRDHTQSFSSSLISTTHSHAHPRSYAASCAATPTYQRVARPPRRRPPHKPRAHAEPDHTPNSGPAWPCRRPHRHDPPATPSLSLTYPPAHASSPSPAHAQIRARP